MMDKLSGNSIKRDMKLSAAEDFKVIDELTKKKLGSEEKYEEYIKCFEEVVMDIVNIQIKAIRKYMNAIDIIVTEKAMDKVIEKNKKQKHKK